MEFFFNVTEIVTKDGKVYLVKTGNQRKAVETFLDKTQHSLVSINSVRHFWFLFFRSYKGSEKLMTVL